MAAIVRFWMGLIAGCALIVAGIALVSLPAAVIAAGVLLVGLTVAADMLIEPGD